MTPRCKCLLIECAALTRSATGNGAPDLPLITRFGIEAWSLVIPGLRLRAKATSTAAQPIAYSTAEMTLSGAITSTHRELMSPAAIRSAVTSSR